MKKLIVAILLISLATLENINAKSKNIVTDSEKTLLTSSRTYSADEVTEIVASVQNTAEEHIQLAWEDGYKAGALEFSPESERLKAEVSALKKKQLKRKITTPIYIISGAVVGFCTGYIFKAVN